MSEPRDKIRIMILIDSSRGQAVDPDPVGRPPSGKVACHVDDGCLTSCVANWSVERLHRVRINTAVIDAVIGTDDANVRSDIEYDATTSACQHSLADYLTAQKC